MVSGKCQPVTEAMLTLIRESVHLTSESFEGAYYSVRNRTDKIKSYIGDNLMKDFLTPKEADELSTQLDRVKAEARREAGMTLMEASHFDAIVEEVAINKIISCECAGIKPIK